MSIALIRRRRYQTDPGCLLTEFEILRAAGVIQNGDFSSGLNNRTTDTGFVPPTDGVGFALFAETLDGVQLAQSFTLPGNALSLSFDFQINATGSLIPGSVPINFQATLFTSSFDSLFPSDPNSPILFPAFYSIDNSGLAPEYFDNNFVAVQSLVSGYK